MYRFSDAFIEPQQWSPHSTHDLRRSVVSHDGGLTPVCIFRCLRSYSAGGVQLMIAPLRAVKIKSLLAALKRRWRIFAVTSLLALTLILLGLSAVCDTPVCAADLDREGSGLDRYNVTTYRRLLSETVRFHLLNVRRLDFLSVVEVRHASHSDHGVAAVH